ncbi:MAG TPA: DUF2061 domain-containing protein [Longimicrobiales bacterium]|nr:DUF2061 domain-containing protein [Longimicrobiales bacterium]
MSIHETRARSLVKSLSWRIIATLTTIGLVYAFTGAVHIAMAVGGVEVLAKLLIFYLHERAWAMVGWGFRA